MVNDPECTSIDKSETYYIEKFGEKFYCNQQIPAENGLEMWENYIESRKLLQ